MSKTLKKLSIVFLYGWLALFSAVVIVALAAWVHK